MQQLLRVSVHVSDKEKKNRVCFQQKWYVWVTMIIITLSVCRFRFKLRVVISKENNDLSEGMKEDGNQPGGIVLYLLEGGFKKKWKKKKHSHISSRTLKPGGWQNNCISREKDWKSFREGKIKINALKWKRNRKRCVVDMVVLPGWSKNGCPC